MTPTDTLTLTVRSRAMRTLAAMIAAGMLVVSCAGGDADTTAAAEVTIDSADADTGASSAAGDATSAATTGDPTASSTDRAVVANPSALFDDSVVHDLEITFDRADYDAAIAAYIESDEKVWIEATVTIDGETYEQVGMRLKGNSSLRGLAGGGGMGPGGDVSADDPTTLPWLIRLDEFVEGQEHEGISDLVVRSNSSETALNEAVALQLLEEAGLASQDAIAVRMVINDSEAVLRLVIEHPDDTWMADNFGTEGALYKAESTGDYSYRGDDPEAYDEVFDQEAGKDVTDLTPLIEFLAFIDDTDDATFEAELGDHLDIDGFATYLAMQEVVDNFDDIDGPGNNSYLHYDASTGVFTVVPWDYNLAFGGLGGGMGAGGGPGGVDGEFTPPEGVELPEGFTPPEGVELPEGVALPGGGGGPGGRANVLVERFLAVDEWSALVDAELESLTASLIDSGRADEILASWVTLLETDASDLVDADVVTTEAAAIERYL